MAALRVRRGHRPGNPESPAPERFPVPNTEILAGRERSHDACARGMRRPAPYAESMTNSARFDRGHTDDLMSFLAASPSPYHAVANAAERLEKAGFRQVAETDAWDGGDRREVRAARRRDHRLVRARGRERRRLRTGSSARTPTLPICASSRSPTPARTAGGRSPSRSTAARCSTPGSTATWGSRGRVTLRRRQSPARHTSTGRCCACPSSPCTSTARSTPTASSSTSSAT